MDKYCAICQRIEQIKSGKNDNFVCELKTGYVVFADSQYFEGYTIFISKEHKTELHELDYQTRILFLTEMELVARSVWEAFTPRKLNYELLGNTDPHLHWHIIPRHEKDIKGKPIWIIDKSIRDGVLLSQEKLEQNKKLLKKYIEL